MTLESPLTSFSCLDRHTSQVEKRKNIAQCKDAGYLKQNLNPGRSCSNAAQCKSRNCQEVCVGYEEDEACHKHDDCVEGTYCYDTTSWPFKSVCKKFKEDGDECTEDYQCEITHYCWFKSSTDRADSVKKCMHMYTGAIGDQFGWW